jgi:hypothetical protein
MRGKCRPNRLTVSGTLVKDAGLYRTIFVVQGAGQFFVVEGAEVDEAEEGLAREGLAQKQSF